MEYGKVKLGKLIIETDEVMWVYEVKGDHIEYKPPEIKESNLHKNTKASELKGVSNTSNNNLTRPVSSMTVTNLFNKTGFKSDKEIKRDKCKNFLL